MIILDATTKSLQVVLAATVATNQLPFAASYVDTTGSATTPGEQDGTSNNTTAVTVVSAPASSTQRLVKNIVIQNADTATATVTIIYNNNSTLRDIIVATLAVGDQLIYEDGAGWSTLNAGGSIKTSNAVSSVSNSDGTLTISPTTGAVVASLASLTSAKFLVGNGSNIAAGVSMSGDATLANTGAVTIANNAVTNAKMAQMAADTLKGNNTGSTANASDLTVDQVLSLLGITSITPQGRLTLTSNTPVMNADATAQTSLYYTPYIGNMMSIYDGTNMVPTAFSQLTMMLNTSNQTSGNIYDLFVFLNSGTVTIGAGPAWSTAPSGGSGGSRGTGAGTTELQQTNGLWVNKNTITLKNSTNTYSSIGVSEATYVGSVYMTANGQTGVQFKPAAAAGGSNNTIGLWNAYNRVSISSLCRDSTAPWTYGTNTWEALDANNSNRITYLDGLGQSFVRGAIATIAYNATSGNGCEIGVNQNATSGSPTNVTSYQSAGAGSAIGACGSFAEENFSPVLGLNYVQGMQNSPNGTQITFAFNGGQTYVLLEGEF